MNWARLAFSTALLLSAGRLLAQGASPQTHWAFQPIGRPDAPAVRDSSWARNALDAFVLARLEREGIAPSPPSDARTLLRRAALDVTGLQPSPEAIEEFLHDESPFAYDRAVERLLASPAHAERWARHWLDLARYGDSNGYTIDGSRSLWKWRDWVIDALRGDMPFDQFTIEQIAGDLLPEATREQRTATGFHRNTLRNEEGGTDPEEFRVEAVADRVNTTATVFLGLTLGCARCHDHKYDPLSQREYFELFALLNNCDEPELAVPTEHQAKELPTVLSELQGAEKLLAENEDAVLVRQREWEEKNAALLAAKNSVAGDAAAVAIPEAVRAALVTLREKRSEKDSALLVRHYRSIDKDLQPILERIAGLKERKARLDRSITTTLVLAERNTPRATHVHLRGDFLRPGARVEGGVPRVLPPLEPAGPRATRLDLARWLVDRRNPLTARVTVNRIWQIYFGRGLVETENDFGTRGERPTHPELLDWLARLLIESGWSRRAVHRMILTSATYRQSSRARLDLQASDPLNRLLACQSRLRLEAEAVRDVVLAASGLLTLDLGGPGFYPPQPAGWDRFTQTQKRWPESQGRDRYRRGLYVHWWRSSPYPALVVFDAPGGSVSCTRRVRSNTPLQALTLANDPAFVEAAHALAERIERESGPSDGDRVARAFLLALGRLPDAAESSRLAQFLLSERAAVGDPGSIVALARVVLNLDELITRE